jgi:predicted O-methyltransferase YrrM
VGVDLFVGSSDLAADVETVRANITAACGEADRLTMLVADSLELTSEKLARDGGEASFRFISIDGGHTREVVFRDLETAYPMLQRGGIIALDDVFNHSTPGVVEGVTEFFLRRKPALAPFALCANKMFVTTPDFHDRYLRETLAFVEAATWLPMHQSTLQRRWENIAGGYTPTMFGYEIIPFL